MAADLEKIYHRLYRYCENENFAGHDPFDGLNSALFQLTPMKHIRLARLGWQQMIKRSPVHLRNILKVNKGQNSKGLALFALAELSRFRVTRADAHADNARSLIDRLLDQKIIGKAVDGRLSSGFGYNFDWQSRHFFAPRGTPAVVPTAFAARALIEAYETLGDDGYLAAAGDTCAFIVNDLNLVVDTDDEACFSYTPLDQSIVYNANLLAGETLARVGAIERNKTFLELAKKAARFVIRRQRGDGAWPYGDAPNQQWVDNFHTAYVLSSLKTIAEHAPDAMREIEPAIERGKTYWLNNFFLDDGTPKYYDNAIYPIDTHACAVSIIGLCEFEDLANARKVAEWTAENMLDADGYFYYQIREGGVIKTPFMRWSQAWMSYALATLIEAEGRG